MARSSQGVVTAAPRRVVVVARCEVLFRRRRGPVGGDIITTSRGRSAYNELRCDHHHRHCRRRRRVAAREDVPVQEAQDGARRGEETAVTLYE